MRHRIHPLRTRALSLALFGSLLGSIAAHPAGSIPLAGTTTVVGTVRGTDGHPIATASVGIAARDARPALSTTTAADGRFRLSIPRAAEVEPVILLVRRVGYEMRQVRVVLRGDTVRADVELAVATTTLEEVVTTGVAAPSASDRLENGLPTGHVRRDRPVSQTSMRKTVSTGAMMSVGASATPTSPMPPIGIRRAREPGNTEGYDHIQENEFRSPRVAALSTFSVDVDRASYTNVRRYLSNGSLPPADAVRIEELVNYFPYGDPAPSAGEPPIRISTEIAPAPWNARHDLVRIALRAREVDMRRAPASNLVFLVDVSGSMMGPGRLPLVKESLALLVNQMREQDRIAIVVYAGNAGLVLPSTSGEEKQRILATLDRLEAGGSTAGGAGIRLAYDVARQNFIRGGNNRVILCTDGDFNVGASSDGEMVSLIEQRRKEGSYLTILGFGMGNYKDSKMEKLAGAGNGNYGYIDDLLEARKMLVKEMGGTLLTVAKDVKLQVEFNPARVQAYRLLGYEDRLLRDEDFANDAKDAGDVGAGHTVTALYEIVRADERLDVPLPGVAPLRYQRPTESSSSGELLHVAMRYKAPDGERSELVTHPVRFTGGARASESMRFASAVAGFGMLLRHSPNAGSLEWNDVVRLARSARGSDDDGYRAEFIRLAELAAQLSGAVAQRMPDRDDLPVREYAYPQHPPFSPKPVSRP